MSHFAKLDKNSVVIDVVVGDPLLSDEQAHKAITDLLGGKWIQTSYNGNIRYNYAGVGYSYDPIDDAFIAPIPCDHAELTLNEQKRWECSHASHVVIIDES